MMLSPPSAKKLSSIPTRSSPRTSANSPQRISSCGVRATRRTDSHTRLRRRQRTTVELAVGRERKTIQNHERRRHHVLGKAAPQMRTQRRRIRHRSPRRNHIANQPLAPGAVLARNHRRLRNIPMANQRRLDLARLDAEATHLHLRIRTTQKLQHPINAPARQGPRCGTSGSPPHRTGPQQTAPPSDPIARHSPAQGQNPLCKALRSHQQGQAQDHRPERRRDNWQSGRPIGTRVASGRISRIEDVASMLHSVGP